MAVISNTSTVNRTLEINQEINLDELMAHVCLMQGVIPEDSVQAVRVPEVASRLDDFSIHEGELASEAQDSCFD